MPFLRIFLTRTPITCSHCRSKVSVAIWRRRGGIMIARSQTADVHYLIELCLHSLECDLKQALRHYDRALELGFDEFWIRYHRGRLRQTLGNDEGAESDLARAARLRPEDRSAQEMVTS